MRTIIETPVGVRKLRPAIKFFNSRYLPNLINLGEVRIGTIEEYRVADAITGGRSDVNEGIHSWVPGAREVLVTKEHPFIRGLFRNDPARLASLKPTTLIFQKGSELAAFTNAYIFCMSYDPTRLMFRKMKELFGYDMYFRVAQVSEFFRIITDSDHRLRTVEVLDDEPPHYGSVDYVTYTSKPKVSVDFEPINPFLKGAEFRWQKEIRAVWTNETPGQPFLTRSLDILPLIKIHRIPD